MSVLTLGVSAYSYTPQSIKMYHSH